MGRVDPRDLLIVYIAVLTGVAWYVLLQAEPNHMIVLGMYHSQTRHVHRLPLLPSVDDYETAY